MRGKDLLEKMSLMDPRYVEAADRVPAKPRRRVGWTVAAAAAAVSVLAVLFLFVFPIGNAPQTVLVGGIERSYVAHSMYWESTARIWPWEYQTPAEQYGSLTFEGVAYRSRGSALDRSQLGDLLATGTLSGYDEITEQEHRLETPVYAVYGFDPADLVAAEVGEDCIVFAPDGYNPPQTLGALFDAYALADVLPLTRFSVYQDSHENGYFTLADDTPIWELLYSCRDAAFVESPEFRIENGISFTATSDVLGAYKRVLYITEDGYLKTNVWDYAYAYRIGETAAAQILAYAKEQGTPAAFEPYTPTLSGTLVSVEDDYILVDDTVLCQNPADGIAFRIPTDDLRIRRCVELGEVAVGDVVQVSFRGGIDPETYRVEGAYSVQKGYLSDGDLLIPE